MKKESCESSQVKLREKGKKAMCCQQKKKKANVSDKKDFKSTLTEITIS